MEGAWTGIIMCYCEYFQLEYELSMTDKSWCIYDLHLYMPSWCTNDSSCHPNLNDLVGRETCHKRSLTDEAEHGANDTTPCSRLMNARTSEPGMFNGFAMEPRCSSTSASKLFKWLSLKERLRGIMNPPVNHRGRKLRKMSAFGELMERMSNGLRDSTPIHLQIFMHLG